MERVRGTVSSPPLSNNLDFMPSRVSTWYSNRSATHQWHHTLATGRLGTTFTSPKPKFEFQNNPCSSHQYVKNNETLKAKLNGNSEELRNVSMGICFCVDVEIRSYQETIEIVRVWSSNWWNSRTQWRFRWNMQILTSLWPSSS